MATKEPLQERYPDNFNRPAMVTGWRQSSVQEDAKPLKSTAHLSVKTERENSGKRSRDSHSQSRSNPAIPVSGQSGSKKSRGCPGPGNKSKKKPAPALPPGRPHLARRVGGIAPNGNPQCWYAPHESEMDPHRIAQRMKQVEFGKNSTGYKAYILAVPLDKRRGDDPQTPDVRTKCSKRCFDGLLRSWRRRLHRYDPPEENADVNQEAPGTEDSRGAASCAAEVAQPRAASGVRGSPEAKRDECDHLRVGPDGEPFAMPGTPTAVEPVPWEEIEKMSLCSPLWGDDKDSDISEPDSGDRVTIYTNELSPTPSELYCLQHAENQSEQWGTPRSQLSLPPDAHEEREGTPNSPYSPWAPWGNSKASFADALRSPAGLLDLDAPTAGAIAIPSRVPSAPSAEAVDTAAPPQPLVNSAARAAGIPLPAMEAPATFGAAFASGVLRNADVGDAPASVSSSLFGAGLRAARVDPPKLSPPLSMLSPPPPAPQELLADMDLEPEGQSISMRAMPKKESL